MNAITTLQPPRTIREVWESLPEGTRAQVVENQLIMSPQPSDSHQEILNIINVSIFLYVEKHTLGKVRIAPYGVYLDEENVFEPDLTFISTENLHKIRKDGLHGAPDLVVEVLPPSNTQCDKNQKKEAYERNGVKEYWIVDPETKEAEGFFLEDGNYGQPLELQGKIACRVLDHEFKF